MGHIVLINAKLSEEQMGHLTRLHVPESVFFNQSDLYLLDAPGDQVGQAQYCISSKQQSDGCGLEKSIY